MSRPLLRRLTAHLRWADALICDALQRNPGDSSRAARELYAHILGAEDVWLARIQGRPPDFPAWPSLGASECAALAKTNSDELDALLERSESSLRQSVRYRNSSGAEFDSTIEDILLHIALHGQYHRGQVNILMRQAGLEPAPVDYIAFVRGIPAAIRHA